MLKQGSDYQFEIRRLFEINEVEITRVDCIILVTNVRRESVDDRVFMKPFFLMIYSF